MIMLIQCWREFGECGACDPPRPPPQNQEGVVFSLTFFEVALVARELAVASHAFQPSLIRFLIPFAARYLCCAVGEQALSNLPCF